MNKLQIKSLGYYMLSECQNPDILPLIATNIPFVYWAAMMTSKLTD